MWWKCDNKIDTHFLAHSIWKFPPPKINSEGSVLVTVMWSVFGLNSPIVRHQGQWRCKTNLNHESDFRGERIGPIGPFRLVLGRQPGEGGGRVWHGGGGGGKPEVSPYICTGWKALLCHVLVRLPQTTSKNRNPDYAVRASSFLWSSIVGRQSAFPNIWCTIYTN